jgi:VIT1/CCC1 family predicted Fe2+/Mn2+ transporter
MDTNENLRAQFRLRAIEKFHSETLDKLIKTERENELMKSEIDKLSGQNPDQMKKIKKEMARAKADLEHVTYLYNERSLEIENKIQDALQRLSIEEERAEKAKEISGDLRSTVIDLMMETHIKRSKKTLLGTILISFIVGVLSSGLVAFLFSDSFVAPNQSDMTKPKITQQAAPADADKSHR